MEVTTLNSLVLFNPSAIPYGVGIIIPSNMKILRSSELNNLPKATSLIRTHQAESMIEITLIISEFCLEPSIWHMGGQFSWCHQKPLHWWHIKNALTTFIHGALFLLPFLFPPRQEQVTPGLGNNAVIPRSVLSFKFSEKDKNSHSIQSTV